MSTFLRRLLYYGIGFGIGCIFVFFFFQNRGCSWLPDNRVKNAIMERVIVVQEDIQKELDARKISNEQIISLLNDGKVVYSKSKKEGTPKAYMIERDGFQLLFTLPEESFISEVRMPEEKVASIKNSVQGTGRMIHFPNDQHLIYVDSTDRLNCERIALGFKDHIEILDALKSSGEIDFSKTSFTTSQTSPKAKQYILFTDKKGEKIGMKAEWRKNRISVYYFELPFQTGCL